MAKASYQEKLSRQFTRYVVGMVLLFFAAFTVILLVYTLGFNRYRNLKYNELVSNAFTKSYGQYADFLLDEDTRDMLLRRLTGEVSDNYTSYYYNSFDLTTGMTSGLMLTDASGHMVYTNVDNGQPGAHMSYFNRLVQQNLAGRRGLYSTVYSLFGATGKYVLAMPLYGGDGRAAGAAAIYVDGSGWEAVMRQNQVDGAITDGSGHIIAASNQDMMGGINRFQPDAGGSLLYDGQKYWISTTYLSEYDVYVHTFLKNSGVGAYYAIALAALTILLLALLLTGRTFARRIANLNSRSLEILHNEISAIQERDGQRRITLQTADEFEDIADHINTMLDHLQALSNRNLELGRLNNQMERLQLEAQFDPHFLYNTLESIRYAIRLGDQNVDSIILKLTALLRYSISAPETPVVLREDLCHLEDYLSIISYRFQTRFRYNLSIPPECLDHPCPRLCLQPIVENSVKYGLQQREVLTVSIRAWEDEDFLYLEVRDDGTGMSPALLAEMQELVADKGERQSVHYGLRNIARRLSLQFGAGSGLELDSDPGEGTRVLLRIAHVEVGR